MTDISTVRELAAFYDKFKIVFRAQGSLRFSFSDRTKLLPVNVRLVACNERTRQCTLPVTSNIGAYTYPSLSHRLPSHTVAQNKLINTANGN